MFFVFYSVQQSLCDLFSKSIARNMAEICCEVGYGPQDYVNNPDAPPCYSAQEICTSHFDDAPVETAVKSYKEKVGDRVLIFSSFLGLKPMDICASAVQWANQHPGERPMIIVDYLQGLSSAPDDTVIDSMRILNGLQSATDSSMLILSTLDPNSYMSDINFSSFNECDSIENYADVIWGLQFSAVRNSDTDKTISRTVFFEEMRKTVRSLDLLCIKNRFGTPSYNVTLMYMPEYDIFTWPGGMSW